MNKNIDWKQGEPFFEGLYLTAVRFPNGLGQLDLMFWENRRWLTYDSKDPIHDYCRIVGFASTSDIIQFCRGNWPQWDDED